MDFKYLIDKETYESNIVKFWEYYPRHGFKEYHGLITFFYLVAIILSYRSFITKTPPPVYINLLIVFVVGLLFYILGLIALKRKTKRNKEYFMNEALKNVEKMFVNTDLPKIMLKYNEKQLYISVDNQEFVYKTKNLSVTDVGSAYCICVGERKIFLSSNILVVPKQVKVNNEVDKEYTEILYQFINVLAPKTLNRRIVRWHKKKAV